MFRHTRGWSGRSRSVAIVLVLVVVLEHLVWGGSIYHHRGSTTRGLYRLNPWQHHEILEDEDDCGGVAAPKPPHILTRNISSRSRNKFLSLNCQADPHHSGSHHAQLPGRVHRKAPAENIRVADMT
jgi:hypothetical protein